MNERRILRSSLSATDSRVSSLHTIWKNIWRQAIARRLKQGENYGSIPRWMLRNGFSKTETIRKKTDANESIKVFTTFWIVFFPVRRGLVRGNALIVNTVIITTTKTMESETHPSGWCDITFTLLGRPGWNVESAKSITKCAPVIKSAQLGVTVFHFALKISKPSAIYNRPTL